LLTGNPELLEELLEEPLVVPEELLDELLDDDEPLGDSSSVPPQPAREIAQHNKGANSFVRMSYPEKVC
jgi:hypothetical protein